MVWKMRWLVLGCLGLAMALALVGCSGFWKTNTQEPALVIGACVARGDRWEVTLSVVNMPNGGVAAIAIKNNGLTFSNIDPTSIEVEGLNGFIVLASDFVAPAPQGAVCAANAHAGIESGPILKFTFKLTGADPLLAISEAEIELGSDLNTLITLGGISSAIEYYTK